ncbi:PAN domain protein, partial [Opisthorchis viverrini]
SANVCTSQLNETNQFCKACTFCSNYGKQCNQLVYLHGNNVNLLKANLKPTSRAWNVVHGLLGIPESKSVCMDCWGYRSPNQSLDSSIWILERHNFLQDPIYPNDEPEVIEPHLIYYEKEDAFYDILPSPVFFKPEVHCEYESEIPKGNLNVRFRADFPKSFQNIVLSHPKLRGCPLTLKSATKIECARKCSLDATYRSIYFNDIEKTCVHMQHTDSLLPPKIEESQEGRSGFTKVAYGIP